jgi:hypothetical protein
VRGDGRLVLPAGSPYERELLAESVRRVARRHGAVHVRLGRRNWVLIWDRAALRCPCAGCGVVQAGLCSRVDAREWCAHCALDAAVTRSARGTCCAVVTPVHGTGAARV